MSIAAPSRRALVVEDVESSMEATLRELELRGVTVQLAIDKEEGAKCLIDEEWSFVLVDLALPVINGHSRTAGVELIKDLRKGRFGERNIDVPLAVVTAQGEGVDPLDLSEGEGFLGMFPKSGDTRSLFSVLLEHRLVDEWDEWDIPEEYYVHVIIRLNGYDEDRGSYSAIVPRWSEQSIDISEKALMPGIRSEIRRISTYPIFLAGLVNIRATTADELNLSDLELIGRVEPLEI